jgi:hypothetical protein
MSFDNVLSNMKDYSFTAVVLGAITGHSFSPAGRPEEGGPSDTK